MAFVQVFDGALDATLARCLFQVGESFLPEVTTAMQAFSRTPYTDSRNRKLWCWDHTYRISDGRASVVESCAMQCRDTHGCLSFDYDPMARYCKLNSIRGAGGDYPAAFDVAIGQNARMEHYDIMATDAAALQADAAPAGSNASNWVATQAATACPTQWETHEYSWIELSTYDRAVQIRTEDWQGSNHAADDGWVDVELEWTFTWYGLEERSISVGSNGLVSFGTPQLDYGGTEPLPCRGDACLHAQVNGQHSVDGLIAVFWTDLHPGASGSVYYAVEHPHTVEAAMVIEWSHCAYFCSTVGQCAGLPHASFELILYPTGDVIMQYQSVGAVVCTANALASADGVPCAWSNVSIGWEDQTGTRGGQIMYQAWPADQTAYLIPWCAHSGDEVEPPVVHRTDGWSTHPNGDARFQPYFDSSCTGTVLAVVCSAWTNGYHGAKPGCNEAMLPGHLTASGVVDECVRGDNVCSCAMACIDSGTCGAFSMRHNDSVCTMWRMSPVQAACTGSNLKSDRLYPSDLYLKVSPVPAEDRNSRAVREAAAGGSDGPRPWTGAVIRDLEPIIFGIMAMVFGVLLGRTLAPVKGRSISDSVDAWYAARQDMRRPPQAQVASPRARDASPRVVQQAGAQRPGPPGAPPVREEPAPPRPPIFMFGHSGGDAEETTGGATGGGGGDGGGDGGGAAETLENPLAAGIL